MRRVLGLGCSLNSEQASSRFLGPDFRRDERWWIDACGHAPLTSQMALRGALVCGLGGLSGVIGRAVEPVEGPMQGAQCKQRVFAGLVGVEVALAPVEPALAGGFVAPARQVEIVGRGPRQHAGEAADGGAGIVDDAAQRLDAAGIAQGQLRGAGGIAGGGIGVGGIVGGGRPWPGRCDPVVEQRDARAAAGLGQGDRRGLRPCAGDDAIGTAPRGRIAGVGAGLAGVRAAATAATAGSVRAWAAAARWCASRDAG